MTKLSQILLILFTAMTLVAETCSYCNKRIEPGQKYFNYNNKIFCSKSCIIKTRPHCATCGKQALNMINYMGKYFCSDQCAKYLAPTCDWCHKSLYQKKFFTENNKRYCSRECLAHVQPPCSICGRRTLEYSTYLNQRYCPNCIKLPRCNSCTRPCHPLRLHDGRLICRKCKITGIRDSETANSIFKEVKNILSTKYNIATSDKIKFHLVDVNQLKKIDHEYNPNERGLYTHEAYTTYIESVPGHKEILSQKRKMNIYILSFLSKDMFREVAAHELMHNWQALYYPQIKDLAIKEGLAEFTASIINKYYGKPSRNRRMMHNSDQIYGDGYRQIYKASHGKGIPGVKQWLKDNY